MSATPDLSAARRAEDVAALEDGEVVDVLVVGGGVTGAGVALDAASRGLRVALLERHDLAFGTSRWSSKLVHGGLRYLATGEFGLARQSAAERHILMRHTAPHLVRALPMMVPLTPAISRTDSVQIRAGIRAGDLLRAAARTPRATLPRPRRLTPTEALAVVPGLRAAGLRGALLSWDGQLVDDARLVVALARSAAALGARILTRTDVTAVDRDGAQVRDTLGGNDLTVRARSVINATGVWAGEFSGVRLRPSRGSHLVVDPAALGHPRAGVTVPLPERNRFVILLPQRGGPVLVGLTDEPISGPVPDVARPEPYEVRFLLDAVSSVLEVPLSESDLLGTYAGVRPLLAGREGRTADLSRRHAVLRHDGVVTVVGGKLTTYRQMAQDAVDAAVDERGLDAPPSATHRLPLVGAADPLALRRLDAPARLVARYGSEAQRVLDLAAADPDLRAPLVDGSGVTGAEVIFALRYEGALDAADVLDRRTRIGLMPARRAAALPRVTELISLIADLPSLPEA